MTALRTLLSFAALTALLASCANEGPSMHAGGAAAGPGAGRESLPSRWNRHVERDHDSESSVCSADEDSCSEEVEEIGYVEELEELGYVEEEAVEFEEGEVVEEVIEEVPEEEILLEEVIEEEPEEGTTEVLVLDDGTTEISEVEEDEDVDFPDPRFD